MFLLKLAIHQLILWRTWNEKSSFKTICQLFIKNNTPAWSGDKSVRFVVSESGFDFLVESDQKTLKV